MNLGTRRIRSAGNGSGSIELTLPSPLQPLMGASCRIQLRDGIRPEIVLQPDFTDCLGVFTLIQDAVAPVCEVAGLDDGAVLDLSAFAVSLFPGGAGSTRPPLAWADLFAIAHAAGEGAQIFHASDAAARVTASMLHAIALDAGWPDDLARAYGLCSAWMLTGVMTGAGAEFEQACITGTLGLCPVPDDGDASRAGMVRLAEHFAAWAASPAGWKADRDAWMRGTVFEITSFGGGTGS